MEKMFNIKKHQRTVIKTTEAITSLSKQPKFERQYQVLAECRETGALTSCWWAHRGRGTASLDHNLAVA